MGKCTLQCAHPNALGHVLLVYVMVSTAEMSPLQCCHPMAVSLTNVYCHILSAATTCLTATDHGYLMVVT